MRLKRRLNAFFIKEPSADVISIDKGLPSLETQLLFGESILTNPYQPNQIFAREQFVFSLNQRLSYYPGQLHDPSVISPISRGYFPTHAVISTQAYLKNERLPLPFGCFVMADDKGKITLPDLTTSSCNPKHLRALSNNFSLNFLIQSAYELINTPYVWGGRFIFKHPHFSIKYGTDCSGFLNLLYRSQNIRIPRNSTDQFQDSIKARSFDTLPVGGMIFLAENDPKRISHVMLKASESVVIDASMGAGKIRQLKKGTNFIFTKDKMHIAYKNRPIKISHAFFGRPRKRSYY